MNKDNIVINVNELGAILKLMYPQYYKHWDLKSCDCGDCQAFRKLNKIVSDKKEANNFIGSGI